MVKLDDELKKAQAHHVFCLDGKIVFEKSINANAMLNVFSKNRKSYGKIDLRAFNYYTFMFKFEVVSGYSQSHIYLMGAYND